MHSPSLTWTPPVARRAPRARQAARTQVTLEALWSARARMGPIEHVDVVDLFCGAGGFTEGARRCGHRVVLAVDSDPVALKAHAANHSDVRHERLTLPDPQLHALLPPPHVCWHAHGSPPCTKLSVAGGTNRSSEDRVAGMRLVVWFLDFVAAATCASWSLEQVAQEDVLAELEARRRADPSRYAYEVVRMDHYGVPQTRKRVIAGSPWLISRMRDRAEPLSVPRIADVLPHFPANAVGIKGRRYTLGHRWAKVWAKAFNKAENKVPLERRIKKGGLRAPAPTLICSAPHRWADAAGNTVACLTVREHAVLQTLGANYVLPCTYNDAVRLIGNCIPPLFVERIMAAYRRPVGAGGHAHTGPSGPSLD